MISKKDRLIQVKISKTDRETIEQGAEYTGETVASFVRRTALAAARNVQNEMVE